MLQDCVEETSDVDFVGLESHEKNIVGINKTVQVPISRESEEESCELENEKDNFLGAETTSMSFARIILGLSALQVSPPDCWLLAFSSHVLL
jgi:hypothetical protein